jgi:hypothetical protein
MAGLRRDENGELEAFVIDKTKGMTMAIADMIMRLLREGFIARTQAIGLN